MKRKSLKSLAREAASCKACPLWKSGTQTVFGEGPPTAPVMLVGEQPGDREDLEGRPFVGPAGQLLDRALADAGVDRSVVYVTNAVKHFKWVPRGKRRLHKKPADREIAACLQWLESEIAALCPKVIVCLGATAGAALLGKAFRITRQRGELIPSPYAPHVFGTWHPSALLRAPDEESRRRAYREFVADLKLIRRALESDG